MGTINGMSKYGDGAFEGHQKQTRIKVLSVQSGCKNLVTRGHGHASKPQQFIGLCKTGRSVPGGCRCIENVGITLDNLIIKNLRKFTETMGIPRRGISLSPSLSVITFQH